jgi:3-oxoacyl-[acyl-carrier protein] reductase/meso-butanediol dehydrogenase/(S,S)-butanediol dehydrogenase/diacetyl reductase
MKKTVIITGGNKGIGLDISKVFADSGYAVFVGAREDTKELQALHGDITFVKTDVKFEKDHQDLVKKALDKTGRLDTYINNAGFSAWRSIGNIDEEFLSNVLDTNLKGVFWGCKSALAVMQAGANIVNVSSIAGKRGSSNNSAYCSSKFGVNAVTQSLAKEVGKQNIRVNAVCPVIVPTEGLIEALDEPESPAYGNIDGFIDNFRKTQAALPELPTGEEIGKACLFLASDDASAVTGQCINVDCGVFPQ